jgi:hypothetical protein
LSAAVAEWLLGGTDDVDRWEEPYSMKLAFELMAAINGFHRLHHYTVFRPLGPSLGDVSLARKDSHGSEAKAQAVTDTVT